MIKRSNWLLAVIVAFASLASASVYAKDLVKPFILANSASGDVASVAAATRKKLTGAGFEVVGSYSPYADVEVIVFTNDELKTTATKSKRGGYGAAMRASVTKVGDNIEVAYTNPIYWANAYRMSSNLDGVGAKLKSALGMQKQFGTGDKELTAEDMREYHYTVMMNISMIQVTWPAMAVMMLRLKPWKIIYKPVKKALHRSTRSAWVKIPKARK